MEQKEVIEKENKYLMQTYRRKQVYLVSGKGSYVYDNAGNKYLDLVAGIAVNTLGYAHPKLTAAVETAVKTLHHTSNLFYTRPQVELAEKLMKNSPFGRVFFANSGAEAVEGAIKLARKYWWQKGEEKYEIITAVNSFHGRTMGALSATGQEKYQKPFRPLVPGFVHVPYNDLDALEKALTSKTAAVILEPVQGESGVYPADPAYLQEVAELCREKNILLIFDEVQTGIGRTGKLFAFEHFGVVPDIITLAKGLAGGVPIGAVLAKEEVAKAFEPGDHASTFGGNPLACTAALAVLEEVLAPGFLEEVLEKGKLFYSLLADAPGIKEVRGYGLMLGIELNFPGAGRVSEILLGKGVLINNIGEWILRVVPPLIITREEIREASEKILLAVKEAGIDGAL